MIRQARAPLRAMAAMVFHRAEASVTNARALRSDSIVDKNPLGFSAFSVTMNTVETSSAFPRIGSDRSGARLEPEAHKLNINNQRL